jgi:hypothetical protein
MKLIRRHSKVIALCAGCTLIGAAVSAIATAGAATGSASSASSPGATARMGLGKGVARRAVHGDLVVATGSGFATVTFDRGFIESVNGHVMTISDGTKKARYKTVTLTIPASAKVRDNGRQASLSELRNGQHVVVLQGPRRTIVVARDQSSRR